MTARITLVGCGALGSHLVQFLRNEGDLYVIDFDRVEAKNVLAQFHGNPQRGKLKVESLRATMQFLFGTKIALCPNKLVGDNADVILRREGTPTLVIDALDNAPARLLVQEWARKTGTPCLHGALAPGGDFGRVIWDKSDEQFVVDAAAPGMPTCEGGEFLPFIALTAAYLALSAQQFLKTGRKIGYVISPGGAFPV